MIRMTFTEFRQLMTDRVGYLSRSHAQHGSLLHFNVMGIEIFVLSEPDILRDVLLKHSKQMRRDALTSTILKRIMGEGVFTAEGEAWQRQRKMIQPAFHATRIRDYTETMAQFTQDMVAAWCVDDVLSIDRAMAQLTLRIIAKTMYGVDLQDDVAKFGRYMATLTAIAEKQLQTGHLAPTWVPSPANLRFKWSKKRIRSLLQNIVKQRRALGGDQGDLLSMILNARNENGQPMSDELILDELITVFFAGQDTTSAALTWAWHLLMTHPEVTERLRAEVGSVLGDEMVSFEKLAEMPYLEAVIKEALRLYPPAPLLARLTTEPFTVGQVQLPKNALLFLNIFELHRRPEQFPDPTCFKPERFLDEDKLSDRYAYIPFSAAPAYVWAICSSCWRHR